MAVVSANGISVAYDEVGDKAKPAIVLIMGLGMQLLAWPDAFCQGLADRGFRVIRFDNRDTGLSTKVEGGPPIDLGNALLSALTGKPVKAPYTLRDMAGDALGLLDALDIARAHMIGASMGGMIAQIIAAEHADRTRSLVSIMSSSGNRSLPQGKQEVVAALLAPRPSIGDREAAIQHSMKIARAISSPGYPPVDADLRARIERSFDRSYYPVGVARHFMAVLASGDRVELLKRVRVPTLVVHGADDPLVPVEAGKETAALVPGAKLTIVPGMGHDLPAGLFPILTDSIAQHCKAVDAST
ncbi:MAG TPA: alpha/beta fold hydrolase [Vineibacter sp.]|nr:alpha/beta fold hydrolase [Vineibacter sp.]